MPPPEFVLESERRAVMPKPLFLKLVMIVVAVGGVLGAGVTILFLAAAGGGAGPYTVNGPLVSREEFMAIAIPALGSYTVL